MQSNDVSCGNAESLVAGNTVTSTPSQSPVATGLGLGVLVTVCNWPWARARHTVTGRDLSRHEDLQVETPIWHKAFETPILHKPFQILEFNLKSLWSESSSESFKLLLVGLVSASAGSGLACSNWLYEPTGTGTGNSDQHHFQVAPWSRSLWSASSASVPSPAQAHPPP